MAFTVRRRIISLFLPACFSFLFPSIHSHAATFEIGEIILQKDEQKGEPGVTFIINNVYIHNYSNKNISFAFRIRQENWLDGSYTKQNEIPVPYDAAHWKTAAWFFYPLSYLKKKGKPDHPYHGNFFIIEAGTQTILASKDILFSIKSITDYCMERIPRLENHPVLQHMQYDVRLTGEWVGINLEKLEKMKITIGLLSLTDKGKGTLRNEQWKLVDSGVIEMDNDASSVKNFSWFIELTTTDENKTIPALRIREDQGGKEYSFRYAIFDTGTLGWIDSDEGKTTNKMIDSILFFPKRFWDTYWEENSRMLSYSISRSTHTISMEHIPLIPEMASMYRRFRDSVLME
jgi:hypothetical protein